MLNQSHPRMVGEGVVSVEEVSAVDVDVAVEAGVESLPPQQLTSPIPLPDHRKADLVDKDFAAGRVQFAVASVPCVQW